jgi:signal transduction histidine kinase
LKYSPVSSLVIISASPSDAVGRESDSSSLVCICVKDTGPGIPAEEIPFLFEKFVRLKRDLSSPVRGTGLGLYISKELVEAMGGRIWVESSGIPGEGSRFCFTLPGATDSISGGSDLSGSLPEKV